MPGRGPKQTKYGSVSLQVPGESVSFLLVPPELLLNVVNDITVEGDCIMFSRTREGGAIHIRILADGLVEKWYCGNHDELMSTLEGLQAALSDSKK